MANMRHILLLGLVLGWLVTGTAGQEQTDNYPEDAERLYVLARDLWSPVELESQRWVKLKLDNTEIRRRLRQGCVLLEAAVALDRNSAMAWRDQVSLLASEAVGDPGRSLDALVQYSQLKPSDYAPVDDWLRFRLSRFNERKEREAFLQQSLAQLVNYPVMQSKIWTEMAILSLEKGDDATARQQFARAFTINRYNFKALDRLIRMPLPGLEEGTETDPARIEAQKKLIVDQRRLRRVGRWRLQLQANPYDREAVLRLIEILEHSGRDKLALPYYEHALRLQKVLGAKDGFTEELQLRQLAGAYKAGLFNECIRMGTEVLQSRPDDLLINAVLGMAMRELGMTEAADTLLKAAADKAIRKLGWWIRQNDRPRDQATLTPSLEDLEAELAWFFCFAYPDPIRALRYTRRGVESFTADARKRYTLAYAHTLNRQWDSAESLLTGGDPNDPVAALAWNEIYIGRGDQPAARRRLEGVDLNQAGLLSQMIRRKLDLLTADPNAVGVTPSTREPADPIETALTMQFNNLELPLPEKPEDYVRCTLRLRSDRFAYGDPIRAQLYLTNISEAVLLLGPDSFLDPLVVIAAEVSTGKPLRGRSPRKGLSGGSELIPLVSRYLNQSIILESGRSNHSSEILNVGPLRELLEQHPQQDFQIAFHVFLDPVFDEKGKLKGRLPALQPKPVRITRPRYYPTSERLKALVGFLQNGTPNQRIQTSLILGGLLREADLAARGQLSYQPRPFDTDAVRNMIVANLDHEDFRVQAWSVYALSRLDLSGQKIPLAKMSRMLNHSHWFVRFLTGFALADKVDLADYLPFAAQVDQNEVVKRQAQMLLGRPWDVVEIPLEIPETAPAEEEIPVTPEVGAEPESPEVNVPLPGA